MKREVDTIIFDLDGTLVDSGQDIAAAVNATLQQVGLVPLSHEEVISFIGTGFNDLIRKSLGKNRVHLFDSALSFFKKYYRAHCADTTRLYPHVTDVLDFFRDKELFVVTNKRSDMAEVTLDTLGVSRYFRGVIGGDDEACLKPLPCPINRVLKPGCDRSKALIVGDMVVDVQAGKAAGILTCAVTYGLGKKDDLICAGPDYVIDDLRELTKIVC